MTTNLKTLQGPNFSLQASIVSVHGPPRRFFEPLKLLIFDINADPDSVFTSNMDPDLSSASKMNADPCGFGIGSQCCGSGSEIRCLFDPGIRDEQFGSYFLELRNHFFGFFFGVKIL